MKTFTLVNLGRNDEEGVMFSRLVRTDKIGGNYSILEPINNHVPSGVYTCVPMMSPSTGKACFHITGNKIDHRMFEIHTGNFRSDTKGCMLIGMTHNDISVLNSRVALGLLLVSNFHGFKLIVNREEEPK